MCFAVPSRAAVQCGPHVLSRAAPRGGAARYCERFRSTGSICQRWCMNRFLLHVVGSPSQTIMEIKGRCLGRIEVESS